MVGYVCLEGSQPQQKKSRDASELRAAQREESGAGMKQCWQARVSTWVEGGVGGQGWDSCQINKQDAPVILKLQINNAHVVYT